MQEELQNLTKILLENLILKIKKIRVKIGDIHRIEKKDHIAISVFDLYIKKILRRKKCWFIIDRRRKQETHYVLIKDYNTFMYDLTLYCRTKYFCCYDLKAFTTEILNCDIQDWFRIHGKQRIMMPKKS